MKNKHSKGFSKQTKRRSVSRTRPLRFMLRRLPSYIIIVPWVSFTLFAFTWVILTSLKSNRELFAGTWKLPSTLHLENYVKAWSVVRMGQYSVNSLVVVVVSVMLLLIVSAPAAYALTRIAFRGREASVDFFAIGMGIPVQLIIIPLFVLLHKIHLTNSLPGLILSYVSLSLPFTVFLLTSFFRTLPPQLEEAAVIDGCTHFGVFWRIMLPLASPGLITAAIISFIGIWNEYFIALVIIVSPSKRTLSLGLYALQGAMQWTADWVGLFAGVTIVLVPTCVMYIILSERIISGLTFGAVKE